VENTKTQSGHRNSVTRRISQNMKLKSNSDQYLNSLKKLINKIKCSNVHYVKLINTALNNEDYKNNKFDDKFVLKQIYSSGIIESIYIAKSGFFIRDEYEVLVKK